MFLETNLVDKPIQFTKKTRKKSPNKAKKGQSGKIASVILRSPKKIVYTILTEGRLVNSDGTDFKVTE